jgi:GT2 family glycosyltransferase/glycosyltransferase involved in cell wall biosynthesis
MSSREAAVRSALAQTGLFDARWYIDCYPDVAAWPGDPFDHFVLHGDKEGRSPHPLFDVQWYLDVYPDVAAAGGSPLLHLLRDGFSELRNPNPLFSTRYYLASNRGANSGTSNPLTHYIASWTGERLEAARKRLAQQSSGPSSDPHPLFDCHWYLARYGATIPVDVDPLTYHLTTGRFQHLDPHPLIDSRWYQDVYGTLDDKTCVVSSYLAAPYSLVRSPSPLFDRQWYVETYPDLIDHSVDPLVDYIVAGRFAGRLPHPLFATEWYVKNNPAADDYPGGPLCHFRDIGAKRGLDPHPLFSTSYLISCHPEAAQYPSGPVAYYLLHARETTLQAHPLFDPRWYVACNPEALERPVAPLVHLLGYGVWQDRDPHPLFDTQWYLSQYPQARQPFVHPLVHYLETGSALGHWPTSFFDPSYYLMQYPESAGMDPLIHFSKIGMERGFATNEDVKASYSGTLRPDIYNSEGWRFSRYVRAIGLVSRLVLACDAVKRDKEVYQYYLRCLAAAGKHKRSAVDDARKPLVTVVLPTYNGLHFTLACIDSIARFRPKVAYEVIVADNVSTDDTEKVLKRRRDIRYVRHPENLGFLRSCNRAARMARGEFIFLLNNDTLVSPGWLDELYAVFCSHENVGLVGSRLIYPDGRLQEAGGIIWQDGSAWNYGKFQDPSHPEYNYLRETDYVSGAAIMLPKRLWDEVGGFDEMYAPSYCEDSDLALRVRSLGYSVLYTPLSVIFHFEGMTQGRDTSSGIKSFQVSNTEKLLARWKPMISAYQPNGEMVDLAKDRGFTKRALFIDECTPAPKEDAGSVTTLNMMRLLRSRGYLVTFVPRSNYLFLNDVTQDLQREGIEVLYGHYVNSVAEHLERHGARYDIVFMMRPQSFENHIHEIVEHAPQAKLIYHTCDLHYLRFEREAELTGDMDSLEQARRFKTIEHRALMASDASIVHSTTELEVLARDLPQVKNVHLFGWAIPVPGTKLPLSARKGAIFVGGFNHGPNVDAVKFFIKEVLPLVWKSKPNFEFHVVGSKMPPEIRKLASKRVITHGFVENLKPLLESVQMAVAPLRYGAGIKGKIATAMSVGLPNVVTTIGAEGMGLTDGKDCLIADSPKDIAAAVCRLIDDKVLWNSISQASVSFCEQNYGTTAAERIFDSILAEVGEAVGNTTSPKLVSPTGAEEEEVWLKPLAPVVVVHSKADYVAFQKSKLGKLISERDRYARIRMHDRPELGYPAYSFATGQREVFVPGQVALDGAEGSLRDAIVCPVSGLGNLDRLLATLLRQEHRNSAKLALSTSSAELKRWVQTGYKLAATGTAADLLVADRPPAPSTRSLAKGGKLIFAADSVSDALDLVAKLQKARWAYAVCEIYHNPTWGHLGDDLIIVRAIR